MTIRRPGPAALLRDKPGVPVPRPDRSGPLRLARSSRNRAPKCRLSSSLRTKKMASLQLLGGGGTKFTDGRRGVDDRRPRRPPPGLEAPHDPPPIRRFVPGSQLADGRPSSPRASVPDMTQRRACGRALCQPRQSWSAPARTA